MNSTCAFIESDFLNKSERLQTMGEGTFGSVSLYNTPRGRFVVKETKMPNKSLGYPPDFLTEIDMLIKLRPLRTVVSIEGICFDLEQRKGFILLEPLDTNLSSWARKTSFNERMNQLKNVIEMIGGTLSVMHHFSLVHNDIKTNNILVQNTLEGPLFKLADFGKAAYVIDSTMPYGGVDKYKPPRHHNVYISEFWAFMVCLVEVILGGRRMISMGNSRYFYLTYSKKGKFDLPGYLRSVLPPQQFQAIPANFWLFIKTLIVNDLTSIKEGLSNIGVSLSIRALNDVDRAISRIIPRQPGMDLIEVEFHNRMKRAGYEHHFDRFKNIMNKFLFLAPSNLSEINIKHYAEVVYIIVVKSRAQHFRYFTNQDTFLLFERALLTLIGFQTVIL